MSGAIGIGGGQAYRCTAKESFGVQSARCATQMCHTIYDPNPYHITAAHLAPVALSMDVGLSHLQKKDTPRL